MTSKTNIAPNRCIVCGELPPPVDSQGTWSYIAGSTPIGALVCSPGCLAEAMRRQSETGRVDFRFPENAKRYKCPRCGRLVVVWRKPTGVVASHVAPQCAGFSSFMENLKPDRVVTEPMAVPAEWITDDQN